MLPPGCSCWCTTRARAAQSTVGQRAAISPGEQESLTSADLGTHLGTWLEGGNAWCICLIAGLDPAGQQGLDVLQAVCVWAGGEGECVGGEGGGGGSRLR